MTTSFPFSEQGQNLVAAAVIAAARQRASRNYAILISSCIEEPMLLLHLTIPFLCNIVSIYSTTVAPSPTITAAAITSAAEEEASINHLEEASQPKLSDAYSALDLALDSVVKILVFSSSPDHFLP
ncbi:hypothetical protein OIU85_023859 [Salix viminalis]|uniref:Uncharacterized protein n=1 Tax=Salix viminalis TaxID=40686 RepID=A0A9Q0Z475_SALVM|nr:hypothetical protein OIU85_023859 [Salix viminalis]